MERLVPSHTPAVPGPGPPEGASDSCEHVLPGPLRVERAAIEQGAGCGICSRAGKHFQLLLGTVVLPGKQQKLEQKRPALGVERVLSQLIAKRRDRLPQSSIAIEFLRSHFFPS